MKKTALFLLTVALILPIPALLISVPQALGQKVPTSVLGLNNQDNFYTKDWRAVCFDSGIVAAVSGALTYTALGQEAGMPHIVNFLNNTKHTNLTGYNFAQYAKPMQLIATGCVAGLAGLYTYRRLNWYTAASKRARAVKILKTAECLVENQERRAFAQPIELAHLVREVHKAYSRGSRPLVRAFRDLASFVKDDFVERVQKLAASACQEDPTVQNMAGELVARAQECHANMNHALNAIYDTPEYWQELEQEREDELKNQEMRAEIIEAEAALIAARAQEKSAQAQEKIARAQERQAYNLALHAQPVLKVAF